MLSQETTPAAREAESGPSPLDALTAKLSRYVPLLTWVVVVVTLLMIPGKIISYGYIPMDDALRHAAKVVSGKPWPEIIVMRSEFIIDPHPGWHAVLGVARQVLNLNAEGLVIFSVVGLMLLVNAAVLPWLRRPEMWLASLLLAGICI